jgi:hypothetical protein
VIPQLKPLAGHFNELPAVVGLEPADIIEAIGRHLMVRSELQRIKSFDRDCLLDLQALPIHTASGLTRPTCRYPWAVHAGFRQGLPGRNYAIKKAAGLLPNAELLINDAPMSSSLDDLRDLFALVA